MKQGFDELNKDDLGYNGFKDFEAGAKSQQQEVEQLQTEIDELQNRVDDAVKELELIHFYKTQNSNNAIKILKGNKND